MTRRLPALAAWVGPPRGAHTSPEVAMKRLTQFPPVTCVSITSLDPFHRGVD